MFQKWLIAFLADRGWRYLRQRRTRKQLQHMIKKRSNRLPKRVKQKQVKREQGFKPGRALTLLALGIGAWAYVRARQSNEAEPRSSHAFDYSASHNTASTAPETVAPTYQQQASVPQSETLAVPATLAEAEEPTYEAQAASAESTLAVPTTTVETDQSEGITSEGLTQETPGSAENNGSATDETTAEQQNM